MGKDNSCDDQFLVSFFELLMHPWKEQPIIQDSIPDCQASNVEEAQYFSLAKYYFYHYRIVAPFFGALGYLSLAKVHFLKYILEHGVITDFIKGSPRLTSPEIFMAFDGISIDNATLLLNQINCPVSIYTELKESLETEDEARFVSAIDVCDISNISPVLKYIKFIIDKGMKMVEGRDKNLANNNADNVDIKKKVLYEQEAFFTEKLGWQPNGKMTRLMMLVMKKVLEWDLIPDAFFDFIYSYHYYLYCYFKGDGAFTESDTLAFEYMFHQPAFEKQYEENLRWWQEKVLEDKLVEYSVLMGVPADFDDKDNNDNVGRPYEEKASTNKAKTQDTPKKEELRLQNYLCKEPKLDKKSKLDYCKGFKRSIAKAGYAGDKALAKFIQGIADRKYIDDDAITKKSFAYALTGRGGFRKMKIIKVKWHHKDSDTREVPESVRVLLYISANLFDSDKTKGFTYSQLFDVLNAGPNPCVKDGKDQSAAYYDTVSDDFKEFFKECFGQFAKDFDKNNHKE